MAKTKTSPRVIAPKKIAASARGRRIRKLASGVSVLEKEILKPGVYVDEDGVEFELTAEEILDYVDGTKQLLGIDFRVNGFPDHASSSSTTKLGRWLKTWVDEDASAMGWFLPKDAASEEIALDNDCSAVLVDGLNLGQVKIGRAMPRIDIVPQGAVLGLRPFKRVAALAAGMKAQRVRRCTRKERCPVSVKSRLAKLLSKCLGMDETELEDEVMASLSSHCMTSKGLVTEGLELGDDDLAGALKEMLMAPDGKEEPAEAPADGAEAASLEQIAEELDGDGEEMEEGLELSAAPSAAAAAPPATKKLSAGSPPPVPVVETAVERDLRAQLASLQRRELDEVIGRVRRLSAKTAVIEAKSVEAIRSDYADDVKAHGHDRALARAKRSLSVYLQLSQALAKPAGKKAERKLATPPSTKPKEEPVTPETNPLLACRGGPWKPSMNGAAAN